MNVGDLDEEGLEMTNATENSDEVGTLRYHVPFRGSVLINIKGTITVEMPSDMPLPKKSAARCVWEATSENGILQEPLEAFKEKLPFCTVSCLPMGCEIGEPQRTFRLLNRSDLRMVWENERSSDEVQS